MAAPSGHYALLAPIIAPSRRAPFGYPVEGLRDLMARMGHDSEQAAMIYQHRAEARREMHVTDVRITATCRLPSLTWELGFPRHSVNR